ncbi:MAG: hypothetical protein ABR521_08620 [Gaiellaceae bacterium]
MARAAVLGAAIICATGGALACRGDGGDGITPEKLLAAIDASYSNVGGVTFRPVGPDYAPGERTVVRLRRGIVLAAETHYDAGAEEFTTLDLPIGYFTRYKKRCWPGGSGGYLEEQKRKLAPSGWLFSRRLRVFHATNERLRSLERTKTGWLLEISFRTPEFPMPEPIDPLPPASGRYVLTVIRPSYYVTAVRITVTDSSLGTATNSLRVTTSKAPPHLLEPKPLC